MLNDQKIVVVMPAYNAARTLRQTYDEVMAHGIVDLVILVDDASHDETVEIARTLSNIQVEVHPENRGYGANQKTCYRLALAAGADIIIMIHPDYQVHTPTDSGNGSFGRQRLVSLRACLTDPWRRRLARRHAVVEIHLQPFPYARGEPSNRGETVRVSYGISCFCAAVAGEIAIANELERFRFRQSNPRSDRRAGLCHRRGDVSSSIYAGSVVDQFSQKRTLRIRLPRDRGTFSPGGFG